MLNPEDKIRLEHIYNQLLEVSNGNFSFQIERTDKKDEIEALSVLVNMVTEEIKDSFLHEGYINFRNAYKHITQIVFVLDENQKILDVDHKSIMLLGYEPSEILSTSFHTLLHDTSIETWNTVNSKFNFHNTIKLTFKTKNGLLFNAQCYGVKLQNNDRLKNLTLLTTFDLVQREAPSKLNLESLNTKGKKNQTIKQVLSSQDIDNIRVAGKYIIDNLEDDLPSLKDLAHNFGINEFKLKKGFKELYGMTVFQFLKTERLKKSHILVEHTNMSFKEIAKTVGFKTASHFSREFYSYYSYRPKVLRLNS
ncbi:helix-turn-helix domain-containing protein [Formosa sp. S-31]|uniref:helix-turn-helix domain-containing protein n=1 Tax=Formosa sp. S-31 TaxID=2790949 RepID=UPI003EB85C71